MPEKHFDVVYDKVFEPWPAKRVRRVLREYREAAAQGSLEELRGASEEVREFEECHPKLCAMAVSSRGDESKEKLLDLLITTRGKQQTGEMSDTDAGVHALNSVLAHFGVFAPGEDPKDAKAP